MSATVALAPGFSARKAATASAERSKTWTWAPSANKARAMTRPRPSAPAETSAVRGGRVETSDMDRLRW